MNIMLLVRAMIVIFLLIAIGYFLYKKGLMTDKDSRFASFLVTNITNPCLLLNSAISSDTPLSLKDFFIAFVASVFIYAVLIGMSLIIPRLMRYKGNQLYQYEALMIYGNTSFIGFPVILTVMGKECLAYASINCVLFNIIIYTYGLSRFNKALAQFGTIGETAPSGTDSDPSQKKKGGKSILNTGTVAAVSALILYILHPNAPELIKSVTGYAGNSTTFLSMLVLGCALASMPLKKLFLGDFKMYLFLGIRLILIPVIMLFFLKPFMADPKMLGTMAILMALPGANMPLMFCKEMGLECEDLARGILLSTLCCIITIPLVCLFL